MFPSGLERDVAEVERLTVSIASELNPDAVPLGDAGRLFDRLDRAARALATAKTLLAPRVAESRDWQRRGHRTAEEDLAARSGTSLAAAKTSMATGKALADNPDLRRAMTQGQLSPDQGSVIADAARANPAATQGLVDTARKANLNQLRTEAGRIKAAADRDPDATHRRLHRERRLTRYTHADGSRHLHLNGPVDTVSIIEAELDRCLTHHIRTLPAGTPIESRDAMAFDAAIAMARRSTHADDHQPVPGSPAGPSRADDQSTTGPDPTDIDADRVAAPADDAPSRSRPRRAQPAPEHLALLRIDIEALWRGHVEGDEICEISGLGPFPIAAARRLLGDAVIKLIITKGDAVAHVTSLTRGPTQAMRYALLWTSPTCTAQGCTRTILEHDHRHGSEYKDTHHTRLDQLDRLCHTHHALHTHRNWALVDGTGKRPMVPPTDPRHPANASRAGGDRASPTPSHDRASPPLFPVTPVRDRKAS